MKSAREITHAHDLHGADCTAYTHDRTCDLVTAGIRHGQADALRWAAKLVVKSPDAAWLDIADKITELESEATTPKESST